MKKQTSFNKLIYNFPRGLDNDGFYDANTFDDLQWSFYVTRLQFRPYHKRPRNVFYNYRKNFIVEYPRLHIFNQRATKYRDKRIRE